MEHGKLISLFFSSWENNVTMTTTTGGGRKTGPKQTRSLNRERGRRAPQKNPI
jgi:hypothetical protein